MRKSPVAWALYDWANSAFTTTVITAFFPLLYAGYWSLGIDATQAQGHLGLANGFAGLVLAASAPVIGALGDAGLGRKRLLGGFALVAILATAVMPFVPEGSWLVALVLYGVAYIGWLAANVIYDSLLPSVATPENVHRVSTLGFALGYLGGGILLAVNAWMALDPTFFGFEDAGQASRVALLTAAVWWAVFSVPLFLRVDEGGSARRPLVVATRAAWTELRGTFRDLRRLPNAFAFLLAYWLYIDGVDTVVVQAVSYGKAIGFADNELLQAVLLVQLVGFPFALLYGWLSKKLAPRTLLFVAIGVYLVITVLGSRMTAEPYEVFGVEVPQFFVLAFLVATSQGGIQALSRSLFSRMIPVGHEARFFGLYNMVGKFGAVLGPFLMGILSTTTGNPRLGIQAIAVFFVAGGLLLARVKVARGVAEAEAYAAEEARPG